MKTYKTPITQAKQTLKKYVINTCLGCANKNTASCKTCYIDERTLELSEFKAKAKTPTLGAFL